MLNSGVCPGGYPSRAKKTRKTKLSWFMGPFWPRPWKNAKKALFRWLHGPDPLPGRCGPFLGSLAPTRKSACRQLPPAPPWALLAAEPSRAAAMTLPKPRAQAAPFVPGLSAPQTPAKPPSHSQTVPELLPCVLLLAHPHGVQWWELRATALNPKRQWFGWWPVKAHSGREKKPSTNENCWTALQTNAFV